MRFSPAAFAVCAYLVSSYCSASVFLDLYPTATIEKSDYTLGEIAAIVGSDSAQVEAMKRIRVDNCGLSKVVCRVTKAQVSARLTDDQAIRPGGVVWGSNETVEIRRGFRQVVLTGTAEEIAVRLAQRYQSHGQVVIKILESGTALMVPSGKVVVIPDFQRLKRRNRDVLEVPLTILVDGVSVKTTALRFHVSANLGRADAVNDDIQSIRVVSEKSAVPLITDMRGSSRVAKDQHVRLILASGDVTVETEGIALESGAVGQEIFVRRPNASYRLRGRVLDGGAVLVAEQQG